MLRVGNPGASGSIAFGDNQGCFKQLFEQSPDPTWVIEGNRFVECNEAAIRTLGYLRRDELLNVHPSKLSAPTQPDGEDSYAKAERMMALAQANGLHRFEWVHTKANGTDLVAEVTLSRIELSGQQVIYCVWRDITERKQVEAALREATRRWQTTFDNTLDAICLLDSDQKILQANASMAALTGISVENMSGKHCWEVVHGTTAPIPQCPLRRARMTLSREQMELQIGNRWLSIIVDPVLGEAQEFQGAVHIIRDITERKQAEEVIRESEARYRALVEWSPEAIVVHQGGKLVYVNPAAVKMIGAKSAQDLVGKPMLDWIHPDFRQIVLDRVQRSYELGITQPMIEEKLLKLDGTAIEVEVQSTPIIYNGKLAVQVSMRDVTEREQLEAALRESEVRFRSLTEMSSDWYWEQDRDLRLSYHSSGFTQRSGTTSDKLLGKCRWEEPNRFPLSGTWEAHRATLEAQEPFQNFEYVRIGDDGEKYFVSLSGVPIFDQVGKFNGYRGVGTNITKRKELEEQLRQLAFYDPLTELPNRRLLLDRLSQSLAESKRSGRYGALMFLDLDNFKALNDTAGHAVGDLLLMQGAKRMKNCVREVDTVARFGGDEFVVMVSDLDADKTASTTQANNIAEKIRAALTMPYLLTVKHDGGADSMIEHQCSASIGVVVFTLREGSQDDFLKWADNAMYQAKNAGGNLIWLSEAKCQS